MDDMNKDMWIAAITRGHNAGVCLLKNGEIVFAMEEERLSRHKYDGGPLASMIKITEFTNRLDYLVIAHTQPLHETAGKIDFTGDDMYTGLARKLGLIDRKENIYQHPQVIDLSHIHHTLHAACAFYRSGFDKALGVIADGAGTFIPLQTDQGPTTGFEVETVYECNYPADFKPIFKHIGTRGPNRTALTVGQENGHEYDCLISDRAGITKVYEAVTQYCGFPAIEAGKTMGLFPYGSPNENIPQLFNDGGSFTLSDRNVIVPTYPNAAEVNFELYEELQQSNNSDLTALQNRRDLAYACQTQTQQQLANYIRNYVEKTGIKNVVVSGGYALNCVANYFYLKELEDLDINLYVEPISNDAGTAIGAAIMSYRHLTEDTTVETRTNNLYLGPKYNYALTDIEELAVDYNATVDDASHEDVIDLLANKNIVTLFQGRSENGPRALGNRSILFDPTFEDGKDYVNAIKRREYFRPFAGTILEEDVHEWFDLRGMDSSPSMMYAVNCQPGVAEKIPSIIHVDGTCRIQTVNREQNPHYYDIIKTFKDRTGCPIIFNTSFNLGGEPLVETLDDAFRTLANSEIEYLYLPEFGKLITIENM